MGRVAVPALIYRNDAELVVQFTRDVVPVVCVPSLPVDEQQVTV